jgi:uncharacterized damage-inducible protein DinB
MHTKQDILEEFNEEVEGTRKMLERVPFDKLDFKPSPKSMPLGQLAFMVGSMPGWFMSIIKEDAVDTSTYKQPPKPNNAEELVAAFDEGMEEVRKALSDMDERSLTKNWSFKMNGKTMMETPRGIVLPQTVRHLVHHRAQLGVYLKMNGIPHPAIYGASGDEH